MNKKSSLHDIRLLSKLLDSKFNIGPFRFGIDSLIGLIPGIGDGVGTALSSYI
ncbi:MAG: DUF4112 domain-containing protein, partial [Bacteriovoracaceae bacterium]|nr:DUF4112 domain-containing protein [Bacteriovoracaceae bacterium]